MTQPVPDGVLVLLPDCYHNPTTKKGEVYGAVICRTREGSLSREVVRVALDCISRTWESAVIPKSLLSKRIHHSTVSTKRECLKLKVRTYDESSVPDFIGKVKAILQKEQLPEEPWQNDDSIKSATLAVDIQTTEPTYLPRRPLVQWTFQTSKPQTSSFVNHVHVSGTNHFLVIREVAYPIEMKILTQIGNIVLKALDDIAKDYQLMNEENLLDLLSKRNVDKLSDKQIAVIIRAIIFPILTIFAFYWLMNSPTRT